MNLCLDEELQVLFLLSSFPESWETLMVSLSNSAPNGVVSMEQVSVSLLNEEMKRRDSMTSIGESQALVSEIRGRGNQETKVMLTRVGASQGQGRILFTIIVVRKGTSRFSANNPKRTRRKIKKEMPVR